GTMRILRGRVASFAVAAACWAAVLAPTCLAATGEVHLHDPAGRSLSGIKVTLWEVLDERWARSISAASEDLGLSRVEGVPVGTWAVTVSLPRDSDFIRFAIPGTPALPPSLP